ncbi:MAG: hypothetical protein ACFB9N_03930 [Geitlerinemataceae cyanobacterium]
MEPIELGILAAGAKAGAAWVWDNGGETVTQEATEGVLRAAKDCIPEAAKASLAKLGERIQAKWPREKNPFDDPELLKQMVEAEEIEPDILEAVEAVEANTSGLTIENWQGINVKGGTNTISGNKFTFGK